MYSNLVKADYEIKDMNLKELREILVKQNNLTPLDILKGFHEKSKIDLEYKSCLTEENRNDIKLIQDEYQFYLDDSKDLVQKIYDEKFNALLAEYQKEEPTATIEIMTHYLNDKHPNMSVSLKNASFKFSRELKDICSKLKSDVEKSAKEYITSWMKEKFGDKYKITKNDFDRFEGLPSSLNVNQNINIDFLNVYEVNKNKFDDGCGFSQTSIIYFDTHIKDDSISDKVKFYDYDMIKVSVHINESKARELFDNAVNSVINQNNSVGELEYLQNLESQPITLNFDSKTNKYQLIDGYKRLLYITDENLLKYSAPIKIFTDLNDIQFLSLLYASNVWKTEDKFHDRGFLFALKTRFGFEIPSSAYKKLYSDELSILKLYDFGGNLVNIHKDRIMNTLDTHEYLVDDISMMYNFLTEESEKNHGYDENISDEIKFTIIELVGELRRQKNKFNQQKKLTKEFITSVFEDEFIKKLCTKKHLSTRTYVINYFRDKGIYNRIKDMIKDDLVNKIIGA